MFRLSLSGFGLPGKARAAKTLTCGTLFLTAAFLTAPLIGAETPPSLPDPDGKPADLGKPVQVYILMGQSNIVGAGKINGDKKGALTPAVKKNGKYPYLVDDQGAWTTRKGVRNVFVMRQNDKMQL